MGRPPALLHARRPSLSHRGAFALRFRSTRSAARLRLRALSFSVCLPPPPLADAPRALPLPAARRCIPLPLCAAHHPVRATCAPPPFVSVCTQAFSSFCSAAPIPSPVRSFFPAADTMPTTTPTTNYHICASSEIRIQLSFRGRGVYWPFAFSGCSAI